MAEANGVGGKGQEVPQALLNICRMSACFSVETFSGNQNLQPWVYIPQVPDYQDFQLSDSGLEQFCCTC